MKFHVFSHYSKSVTIVANLIHPSYDKNMYIHLSGHTGFGQLSQTIINSLHSQAYTKHGCVEYNNNCYNCRKNMNNVYLVRIKIIVISKIPV